MQVTDAVLEQVRQAGFDVARTRHGTGLQGMADRLAAVGGTFRVRSEPGLGTTVGGTLPVCEPARAGR